MKRLFWTFVLSLIVFAMASVHAQTGSVPAKTGIGGRNLNDYVIKLNKLTERLRSEGKDPSTHPEVASMLGELRSNFGVQVAEEVSKLTLTESRSFAGNELNSEIEKAKQEQSAISALIDRTVKKNPPINFTPVPNSANIPGKLVSGPVKPVPEVASTISRPANAQSKGQLYIFASLGLPQTVLDKLVAHAITWRGIIVLRGFIDNDAKKSHAVVGRYIGMPNFQLNIDPFMFKQYQIDKVPAFLMELPGEVDAAKCQSTGECEPQSIYLSVEGDISPTFAFEKMRAQSAYVEKRMDSYLRQFVK